MTGDESESVHRYHHYRVIPALLVIALGVFFLLGNLGIDFPFFTWTHWWAWFILLGAAWPLSDAWARYRRLGKVDSLVLRELLTTAVIAMVALMFILQLSWQQWWPIFVIYGGLCMLVRDPRRRDRVRVR
ncbi:hypothetical protein CS053_08100 [Rhodanobacter glycinis]|uniref:LiaF transmembrane domain-containing protein n=1 Tax=Rhodanobacter glycinis TaxID=582702 RepID=A0A5B9DWU1_9GAMM|nr:hypothetical protein [Rhodanobacter glycinis]QEE24463.1 hypothetical protein CS053_08100 [Rhodanobacter glycinis]